MDKTKGWETIVALIIGILVVLANSWHVISQWLAHPADRLFTGVAHYFADYFLYVSQFAQGERGAWFWANHQFTNESLPPTWIYWFNVLLGRLGSLTGLSAFASYNLSLIFLVGMLIFLWYVAVKRLFPKDKLAQIVGLIFILTASNFFNITKFLATREIELVGQFWFSPTPAFNRLGGVPHQVFQTILLVSVILLFSQRLETKRFSFGIWHLAFGILAALASSANPIQMLLLVTAVGITLGISYLLMAGRPQRQWIFLLTLTIPALLGAYITNAEFARQPILSAAKTWELSQNVSVTIPQFLLAVGPVGLLVPFGLWPFLKRQNPLGLLLFFYGTLSLLAFFSPIPRLLGTTPVRWLAPAAYGLLPLLAAEGVIFISNYLVKSFSRFMILVLYLFLTFPSLWVQIDERVSPQRNWVQTSDLNHVPQPIVAALTKLASQGETLRGYEVVLTDPALPYDVLVPTFTGKISFTGHPLHTLYPQAKESLRRRFFEGAMNEAEAKLFLADHRIGFLLASTNATRTLPAYSFMRQIFQNEAITVYSVY